MTRPYRFGRHGNYLLLAGALIALCFQRLYSQESSPSNPSNPGKQPTVRTWQEIQSTNETSIVSISFLGRYENGYEDKWAGTGFIVSAEGHVVTCLHVMPDPKDYVSYEGKVVIGAEQGVEYKVGKDDWMDKLENHDLALFRLPQAVVPWHSIQSANWKCAVLTPVMGLGFMDQGFTPAIGSITNLRPKIAKHWITSAPLNRGMSGGPVFDETGAVVAIVAAGHPEEQLISEVIPINLARPLLEEAASPIVTRLNQAVQQSAEQLTKAAEKIENTQLVLETKGLDAEQTKKVADLALKAGKSKDAWVSAYNRFVETNWNMPGRQSISERREIVAELKDTSRKYHAASNDLAQVANTAEPKASSF